MRNDHDEATAIVEQFEDSLPSIGKQLSLYVLAERALTKAAGWNAYAKPDGAFVFDGVAHPLSEALVNLVMALRREAAGLDGNPLRKEAVAWMRKAAREAKPRNPPSKFRSQ